MNMPVEPVRILIADSQPLIRQRFRALPRHDPAFEIAGEADAAAAAMRMTLELQPEILLLESALAAACSARFFHDIAAGNAVVRMLVTLPALDRDQIIDALRWGAHGTVLNTAPLQETAGCIRAVLSGRGAIENPTVAFLLHPVRVVNHVNPANPYGLTTRELEIIAQIRSGKSNREVGRTFALSERTVKHHLTNIFGKLGVTSRLQLAMFAVAHQLGPAPGGGREATDQPESSDPWRSGSLENSAAPERQHAQPLG
jgi:DNA-binding NarL/FixJ family response regulator